MANTHVNKVVLGNETLIDLTPVTVTADKLASGYTALDASGALITGTATQGGGSVTQDAQGYIVLPEAGDGAPAPSPEPERWVRPSDWPDLSKMDVSGGDILYMTSYADEGRGFCRFSVTCTGNYTVEVGTISGSTFTAESTQDYASGAYCELYYGSQNGTYKVLRVTGTAIRKLSLSSGATFTIDGFHGYSSNQGIVDIVGKLPSGTGLICTSQYNLVNVEISGLNLSGNCASMFASCHSLTSLDVSSWDTGSVTSMNQTFYSCYSLKSLDVSDWDTGSVTNMSNMFYSCVSLTLLDVSGFDFTKVTTANNANSIFSGCCGLRTSLTLPASMTIIGSSCFSGCRSITEWHFLATTPPTLNNANAFGSMNDYGGKKIYVPAASLDAYKTATNWSTYASYMVGE